MSFQAYLDNVKAKTGKTPGDFAKLAAAKKLAKHGEIVAWLKSEFGLGHGHATAIAGVILKGGRPKASPSQKLEALFPGKKANWRIPVDKLLSRVSKFGSDVRVAAGSTYISLLRGDKKFGIIQPSAAERLDVGIKLKSTSASGRYEAEGKWNAMVTHRVRISDPKDINADLLSWLKEAYKAAHSLS